MSMLAFCKSLLLWKGAALIDSRADSRPEKENPQIPFWVCLGIPASGELEHNTSPGAPPGWQYLWGALSTAQCKTVQDIVGKKKGKSGSKLPSFLSSWAVLRQSFMQLKIWPQALYFKNVLHRQATSPSKGSRNTSKEFYAVLCLMRMTTEILLFYSSAFDVGDN